MARQARGPSAVARQTMELSAAARVVRYWGGGGMVPKFSKLKKNFLRIIPITVFIFFCFV